MSLKLSTVLHSFGTGKVWSRGLDGRTPLALTLGAAALATALLAAPALADRHDHGGGGFGPSRPAQTMEHRGQMQRPGGHFEGGQRFEGGRHFNDGRRFEGNRHWDNRRFENNGGAWRFLFGPSMGYGTTYSYNTLPPAEPGCWYEQARDVFGRAQYSCEYYGYGNRICRPVVQQVCPAPGE